ncbi:phospholipase effector Tle1 domain-containing protein [Streptomyces erythrochromogenes]|uniref:phospholipase effector Tle1 domain-containing protein n=1 Tax=Streptomyces erythrochromogenes TaxID=285574 RepID=UPI003637510D
MKRLAVYIDGTWNVPHNNTNIWRMNLLTALHEAETPQLAFYHQGFGRDVSDRLRGAFGKGINGSVRNCYSWIMENYRPGDQMFIFGFSRGAYIARSLAGFIERCGLLRPGTPLTVREVFERYRTVPALSSVSGLEGREDQWPIHRYADLQRHSRKVEIDFLGVWDTVRYHDLPLGSVRGLSRSQNLFHAVHPGSATRRVYQALAVDEHRYAYRHELLFPQGAVAVPAVEQRWFPGDHANVGGGHKNDSLAVLSLAWMQKSAAACGLEFKEQVVLHGDEHLGPVHDSFSSFLGGSYRALSRNKRHWREIGGRDSAGLAASTQVASEVIDASVFDRWREDSAYRPRNIAEWGISRRLAIGELHGTQDVHGIGLKADD